MEITPLTQSGIGGQIVAESTITVLVSATGTISQTVANLNHIPQLQISEQLIDTPADTYIISPPAARTDTVTNTSGSATITDAAIASGDTGKVVAGTGVPIPAYVGTVVAGVSFTLVDGSSNPLPTTANVSSIVVGAVDLATIPRGTGVTVPTYVLSSSVGQIGGPAGPLDGTGKIPAAQIPPVAAGVQSVTAGDGTITIGGTLNNPTVAVVRDATAIDIAALGNQAAGGTGKVPDAGHVHPMPRLDQILAPTAAVSLNSEKITSLANGTAGTDAAALGQVVPLSLFTTKGDLVVASGNGAVSRLAVGGAGTVLTTSSAASLGVAWVAGAFQPVIRQTYFTSGDVAFPNTSGVFAVISQATSGTFEVDCPASAGHWIEIDVSSLRTTTSAALIDIGIIVGTTIVRYMSTGTGTAAGDGDISFYADPSNFMPHGGVRGFSAASGDIDGGTGGVRAVLLVNSSGVGTLKCSTGNPVSILVKNLGPHG